MIYSVPSHDPSQIGENWCENSEEIWNWMKTQSCIFLEHNQFFTIQVVSTYLVSLWIGFLHSSVTLKIIVGVFCGNP